MKRPASSPGSDLGPKALEQSQPTNPHIPEKLSVITAVFRNVFVLNRGTLTCYASTLNEKN